MSSKETINNRRFYTPAKNRSNNNKAPRNNPFSSMAKLMNKLVDSFEHDEIPDVGCVRAVLAELVLTFLFVFTGVSASMAAGTYPPTPCIRQSCPLSGSSYPVFYVLVFLFDSSLGSGHEKKIKTTFFFSPA